MRRTGLALLAALAAAGCGGDDPGGVLRDTADNFGEVRSGTLAMRMTIEGTAADARGGTVGFALRGPFALPARRGLPTAKMDYTQIAGERRATVTLTTTGRAGFVTVDGRSYRLPSGQLERLRTGAGSFAGGGASDRLEDWVKDPKLSDGGRVNGVEVDRVTGRLDVAAAARDLLRVSSALAPGDAAERALQGESGAELARAVKRSSFELRTGKEDRLLRRLAIAVDLAPRGAPGARIRFDLAISHPGARIRVQPPPNALPASALPSG